MKQIILLVLFALFTCGVAAQQKRIDPTKYREFDFWLGGWNVYKYGTDTIVGQSRITSIVDSVAIQEVYWAERGNYQGRSINKYNADVGSWEQYYVDNGGATLHLRGNRIANQMVLMDVHSKVGKSMNKIVWTDQPNGDVRQTWSVSNDAGRTWKVIFDGRYVRQIK